MPKPDPPMILLSIDLEEFDIPVEFGRTVDDASLFEISNQGVDRIIELCRTMGITATFFTTARYAEHEPARMQRIAERHEVASHGYRHDRFENADLAKSKALLESITAGPCIGFRRARMEQTDTQALIDAGYQYNSSENPTWIPGRYNHFFEPRTAYFSGSLLNIPASVTPWVRMPLFWLAFKNFPMPLLKHASRRTLRHDGYLNIYFHPWEFADLDPWPLPGYIKRPNGRAHVNRLAGYLAALAGAGRFARFSELDHHYRQQQSII